MIRRWGGDVAGRRGWREGGGGQGVIAGEMCPLQPWWHIDSADYVCSVV